MNAKSISRLAMPAVAVCLLAGVSIAAGSTIGTNPPAESITRARIVELPQAQRGAWLKYLDRSERQRQADKNAFQAELKRDGITTPTEPPHGYSARSIPLDRDPSWYASAEARHIADVVVSFQTPAGGWSKNLDMSKDVRRSGERYGPNNESRFLAPGDFDTPKEPDWNYIGTIDNDATITQIEFLARVTSAAGVKDGVVYRAAFLRGIDYLLAAQFPNGGWPQVWPLEGSYHDAITYNDSAMTQVMDILHHVAGGKDEYAFVPKNVRVRAAASFARGLHCIFAAQIVSGGKLTVWPQQDDALTLKPVSGRNYEMPAESSGESADLLMMLMDDLPHPTAQQQRSIRAAAAWFKKTAIYGEKYGRTGDGRGLTAMPGAGPIWARYYQIDTEIPIFGDRDKTIHDNVNDLSRERRNGYAWFGVAPQRALDLYDKWAQQHPESE
ncbi:MAG TPA: pectate lyase [Terracidiphilus sp.]|nr:pectate lyase [Terracidiphilus sp.]